MTKTTKFVFCFLLFVIADTAKLPKYFTKCKISDPQLNDCIFQNIVDNWAKIVEGDNAVHLQKINPLFVPFMQVKVDVNLYGNLTNGYFIGFERTKFTKVEFDLDKKTAVFYSFSSLNSIVGDYEIHGKLFGLNITDNGRTNVTFVGAKNKYYFNYDLKEKKGKQYIDIRDSILTNEDVQRIYFDLELSNTGLGNAVNQVLNDNWKEITNEVRDSVGKALGEIMKALLQPFFNKIPFDELFDP